MDHSNLIEETWISLSTRIRSFILSKIPDPGTADDILQEVFIKAHLRIDSLKEEDKLVPWLFRITRNLVTDYYRRQKVNKVSDMAALIQENEADQTIMDEAVRDMISMMEYLPPSYCEALCLTELEGFSQIEYARRAGIPYSSAKTRVQRARKQLRDLLMKCCHYQFDKYGTVTGISPHSCCCCQEGNK